MTARTYEVAIRNAADTDDAIVFSTTGTNPYIVEAPNGDGESFDPISGAPTTGSYTVVIADAPTTNFSLTAILADAFARQDLIARKTIVRQTGVTLVTGYITAIRLVTASKYEIAIGQSRRIEASRPVFKEATTLFPGVTSVIGGPVRGGFISDDFLPDYGGWTFEVDEDTATHTKLALVSGFDPRKSPETTFSSTSTAIADYTNWWARPEFRPSDEWSASNIAGNFPGLRARLEPVAGGDAVTLIPLARPASGGTWWNPSTEQDRLTGFGTSQLYLPKTGTNDAGATVAFDPALGTDYYVYVYALAVSKDNPMHYYGHPVDLWEAVRIENNIPYDASVLPDLKELIGPDIRVALRVTQPYSSIADFDQKVIYGPFRLSSRIEDGERVLFSTSVANNAAPSETITLADLRSTETTVFDLDESTVTTTVTLKTQTIRLWSTEESDQPEADGLISRPAYPESIDNSDDDIPLGLLKEEVIGEIPGMIWVEGSGPISMENYLIQVSAELFERFGRGGIGCELPCLPSVTTKLGQEAMLDLPHLPGSVVGASPVTQRGAGPFPYQVVQRTEEVEGSFLRLIIGISGEQADSVLPTFTLTDESNDTARYGLVTITNADDLYAAELNCRCDYALGASEPTSGTHFTTILWQFMTNPTFGFAVGPVDTSETLWVRLRAESPGYRPGDWTAWESLNLALSPGTGELITSGFAPGVS